MICLLSLRVGLPAPGVDLAALRGDLAALRMDLAALGVWVTAAMNGSASCSEG